MHYIHKAFCQIRLFFYLGCTAKIKSYQPIGFKSLKNDSTIGISFDAFSNRIDFRTESEIKGYYIEMLQKPSFFRAKVWHSDQASEDYLSVNFGAKPFYYQIPPGYTTLDQDPIKCLTFNHPSIYCYYFLNTMTVFNLLS